MMTSPCVTLWELRPSDDGWTAQHIASVQSLDDYYGKTIRDLAVRRCPRGCHLLAVRGEVVGLFAGRGDGSTPQVGGDDA